MHYSVYAGLAFAALFGLVAPFVARRGSPAAATWLMSAGSVISALSAVSALGLLAMTLVAQNPSVAAAGHWSIPALRRDNPVGLPVAAIAGALLAVGLGRLLWIGHRRYRAFVAARGITRAVGAAAGDLVVLASEATDAYAVPGRPGKVFVTSGMLKLLSPSECDVMLAHERSHLRHHHHWHRTVVQLASALNPLLQALPSTQEWLTERWADEDAARGSDRGLVASALRRAAEASNRPWQRPGGALALAAYPVERRINAMLVEPPRRRSASLLAAVAILAVSVAGTYDGVTDEAALLHAAAPAHSTPALLDRPSVSSHRHHI